MAVVFLGTHLSFVNKAETQRLPAGVQGDEREGRVLVATVGRMKAGMCAKFSTPIKNRQNTRKKEIMGVKQQFMHCKNLTHY